MWCHINPSQILAESSLLPCRRTIREIWSLLWVFCYLTRVRFIYNENEISSWTYINRIWQQYTPSHHSPSFMGLIRVRITSSWLDFSVSSFGRTSWFRFLSPFICNFLIFGCLLKNAVAFGIEVCVTSSSDDVALMQNRLLQWKGDVTYVQDRDIR